MMKFIEAWNALAENFINMVMEISTDLVAPFLQGVYYIR